MPALDLLAALGDKSFADLSDTGLVAPGSVEGLTGRAIVHSADFGGPVVADVRLASRLATLHSLSDIFARGADPIAADVLLQVPRSGDDRVSIARDAIDSARSTLQDEGVHSIGGHTTVGTDLRIGCSVIGLCDPATVMSPNRVRPGDALLISKPIGCGPVYSAHALAVASKDELADAVRWGLVSNRAASQQLVAAGCHAATDISGFGLVGAALTMAMSSSVVLTIDSRAVPMLDAGMRAVQMGAVSDLAESLAFSSELPARFEQVDLSTKLAYCHPETSGGLLCAVEPAAVDELVVTGFHLIGEASPAGGPSLVVT